MALVPEPKASPPHYEGVVAEEYGKLRVIRLNDPKKKNALNPITYKGLTFFLKEAAENPDISIVAITGTGDFYSSGNDFSFAMNNSEQATNHQEPDNGSKVLQDFIDTLIDFPKPLIAVLNGPAIGIAVTTLALMDAVYATESSWLHTPFANLGLCPEGCSSFTFPRIMGPLKASEMLLFGKKINAREAEQLGLITQIYPDLDSVWTKLKEYSELPSLSLLYGKKLVRGIDREQLHKINHAEIKSLVELAKSDQTMEAMAKWFMSRRSSKL